MSNETKRNAEAVESQTNKIVYDRKFSMPNSKTFRIKPIKDLIIEECHKYAGGVIVDPFANEFSIGKELGESFQCLTNDIDPQYETTSHVDALDFLKNIGDESVDIVLYDPPYSPRQVSESYKKMDKSVNMQTTQSSYWSRQKNEIARIVKPSGMAITFGWNTGGIGIKNGFDVKRILLVYHGSHHNDTLCTVERKL